MRRRANGCDSARAHNLTALCSVHGDRWSTALATPASSADRKGLRMVWRKTDRSTSVERCGYGDDGIGGVTISANEKPDRKSAEAAPCEPPLLQAVQVCAPPARREKACCRHDEEAETEDDKRGGADRRWHQ